MDFLMSPPVAFLIGVFFTSVVLGALISESNKQARRELHTATAQYREELRMWREIANHAHVTATDPGENFGGEREGVQVGVGDFFHLEGADILDPRTTSAKLTKPIPAQERTNENG